MKWCQNMETATCQGSFDLFLKIHLFWRIGPSLTLGVTKGTDNKSNCCHKDVWGRWNTNDNCYVELCELCVSSAFSLT